ncbi:MAG: 3-isopropylmalate dehydratase small subunit [Bacteroidetes bacterium HGW-Bacteroidetes-8]|jgi:3-isopropylmalate/(R)-2-methylmalate dehydratase small subunit|nr:MAG: 3-isopropylmalate dehydratase small subunit [Bacteroidetes bacterium HGW-Bacteroidetes-8]
MNSKKFTTVVSKAVIIVKDNIDTDQIIPARFLKTTSREGFGENLFYDWRYDSSGAKIEDFILNTPNGDGTILVAGRNFGCGSSREHAAWAIADYGFRAVVSTFFADIFRSNALNNGLLPVQVSEGFYSAIINYSKSNNKTTLKIDLMKKEISVEESGDSEKFEINNYKQECLINGYDDIDYLLSNIKEIEDYELYKASSL